MDARYEKSPNVVFREIAEERILVPIRKQTADMAAVFVLNETGARIWDLLDGQKTLEDVRDLLVQEYEVPVEILTGDLLEVCEDLEDAGAIRLASHAL